MAYTTSVPNGNLNITNDKLIFQGKKASNKIEISLSDIGSCSRSGVVITVYDCTRSTKIPKMAKLKPFSELPPNKRQERHLIIRKFIFLESNDAENFERELKEKLLQFVDPSCVGRTRKVLTLVNPYSGKKKARKLWANNFDSFKSIQGIEITVIETEFRLHAKQLVHEMSKANFPDIIISVSGDGLVHEIVCGLLEREDVREIGPKIQICHIAGGTSNATANSTGTNSIASAILSIAQGKSIPYDAFAYTIGESDVRYGYGVLAWGIVADVELGTSWMRALGGTRVVIGAFTRVIARKRFPGTTFISNTQTLKNELKTDLNDPSEKLGVKILKKLKAMKPDDLTQTNEWKESPCHKYFFWIASQYNVINKDFVLTPRCRPWSGELEFRYIDGENLSRTRSLEMFTYMNSCRIESIKESKYEMISALVLVPGPGKNYTMVDGEPVEQGIIRLVNFPSVLNVIADEMIYNEYQEWKSSQKMI